MSLVYATSSEGVPFLDTILATQKSGIWAAGERGILLHSDDDGAHWQSRTVGGIEFLGMGETNSGTLILVGRQGLVLRSTSFGSDWARAETGTAVGLYSVACTAPAILAAGDNGAVLRSEDDGRTWKTLPIDESQLLRAVAGSRDGRRLYLAGQSGRIYRSTDTGKSWSTVLSQGKSINRLFSTISGDLVVAVGNGGLVLRSDDAGEHWQQVIPNVTADLASISGTPDGQQIWVSGAGGIVIESNDRGVTWIRRIVPANLTLRGITNSAQGTLVAGGGRECIVRAPKGSAFEHIRGKQYRMNGLLYTKTLGLVAFGPGGIVVSSLDAGKRWQQHNVPTDTELKAAAASGASSIWVVGSHGAIASSSDGSHWTMASGLPDAGLNAVAVSTDGKYVVAAGEKGLIVHSTDGGRTWLQWADSSIGELYAVAISGNSAYFAAAHGTILESDLSVVHVKPRSNGPDFTLRAIVAEPGGARLWAFGDTGTILKLEGGGNKFESVDNEEDNDLVAASCLNNCGQVAAFGENGRVAYLSRSDDSWNFATRTRFDLRSATSAPDGTVFVLGSDFTIFHPAKVGSIWDSGQIGSAYGGVVLPNGTLLAVGDSIWISTDGGEQWRRDANYSNLSGIAANPSGSRIWAVTSGGSVLDSSDSGAHWNVQKLARSNLLQVRPIADKVWAMGDGSTLWWSPVNGGPWSSVSTPNKGTVFDLAGDPEGRELWAACSKGKILHSSDGGKAWDVQSPGTSSTFNAITVLQDRPRIVMATGDGGTIATSHDGGAHWRVSTWTSSNLTSVIEVPRTGQVWTAGSSGTVLISDDRGETWNVANSGTGNDFYSLSYALNEDRIYAFGKYAFQIFTPNWERWSVSRVQVARTLTGLRATIELPRLSTSPSPAFAVRAVRMRELDETSRIEIPVKVIPPAANAHSWELDFDLGNLDPHPGETFDLEACITQNSFVRCVPLPAVTAVPWIDYQKHRTPITIAGVMVSFGIGLTILLFTHPLSILALYRRAYIYEAVGKSGLPGAEFIKLMLSGTLVPFFAFQRRTLDAWALKQLPAFRLRWAEDMQRSGLARDESAYVPLPVELDNELIDTPTAARLLPIVKDEAITEIVGPGGIGKTTLLRQLAAWMLDSRPRVDKLPFPLPVFVEQHKGDLSEYLRKKLKATCSEGITADFTSELLKRGGVVLFFDGFSELEPEFRDKLSKEIQQMSIRSIVISTREVLSFGATTARPLRPKALESKTLLDFVIRLLSNLPPELSSLNTMELQYELGIRISRLLFTESAGAPLTPLLVRLNVERAIDLLRAGRSLDELPGSVGEAYVEYVLQLVRAAGVPDSVLALDLVKVLAKTSLGDRFTPGRFSVQRTLGAVAAGTEEAKLAAIEKLIAAGLLMEETVGLQVLCQFALDPVAEFCAAYAYAEECGFDMKRWGELRDKLKRGDGSATGFRAAVVSVIRAYSAKGLCTEGALQVITDG
jgi:photosystem II stability/assembly factor-like uncharacterized protein